MKLPDRFGVIAVISGAAMLCACSTHAREPAREGVPASAISGPAADYPVVIGNPFEVDGVLHTPLDTMNYDRVGYVAAEGAGAVGVTGAHKTLPLPSYVEVAALDTGRTILVRLERRGPMSNDRELALSPMAMAQLGIADGAPVRMRRVNPPEAQRAKLRAGEEADQRMETPEGLLVVLRRLLPEAGSASLSDPRQELVSGKDPVEAGILTIDPDPEVAEAPSILIPDEPVAGIAEPTEHAAMPDPAPVSAEGKFTIQLGAFSVRSNAENLARKVDGFLVDSGRFTIVRTGPYASRGQAADALAKLRAQGYSDAQIRTLD